MKAKAPIPAELLDGAAPAPLVEAYFEMAHLKQLFRQGWLRSGIPEERCETVAEHTCGVALLSLFLAEGQRHELDLLKVVRLALIHDFGEIYAGDLTPHDPVDAGEKQRLERKSVRRVLSKLPWGEKYVALWEEYERAESAEARFVRQVDRIEMAFQAGIYEAQGLADLSEFFRSASDAVTDRDLDDLLRKIESLRARL